VAAADFRPDGRLDPDAVTDEPNDPSDIYHPPGPWVASYFYDGLGRLIRRSTPGGSAASADEDAAPRHEDWFYDGLRRVAVHVTRPASGTQPIGGGTAGSGSGASAGNGGSGSGSSGGLGGTTPLALASATEYLWGPGGIDEPIGFVTPAGRLRYLIPDADVGASRPRLAERLRAVRSGRPLEWFGRPDPRELEGICTAGQSRATVPHAPERLSATATVRAQYAWEPYGQVVTIDS